MLALIVAYSKNRVIGYNGRIPWDIPTEKKRFRALTTGNVVIMGRRTFDEIGRPLPDRYTIVVSKTKAYEYPNCTTAQSLEHAIDIAREKFADTKDIYIAGGADLYKEAIELVDTMYITKIDDEFEGDTFFPWFDEADFEEYIEEVVKGDIPYTYVTYIRKR